MRWSSLRQRKLWRPGVLLLAVCTLSACAGVPTDATPNTLQGLAVNPTTPPTTLASPSTATATIYYIKGGRLHPVLRSVTSLNPSTLLTLLVLAPIATEAKENIVNVLSPNDAFGLTNPNATSGNIKVELPSQITSLEPIQLYEAYGEIVYTLLSPANNPGCAFTGVEFLLNGQSEAAYLPGFIVSTSPVVTRASYVAIAPPNTPAPTTC